MKASEILAEFSLVAARRLAVTTESSYKAWIAKYLRFLGTEEGKSCSTSERKMEVFLSGMARDDYSRISQHQAFNAILFLYRHVLKIELGDVSALRARKGGRERYCPSPAEIVAMLRELRNTPQYNIRLAGGLLYGCGLRVSEVCQLRIKDIDLDRQTVTVYEGKGDKDRRVRLPELLLPSLRRQIARASAVIEFDAGEGQPVQLPGRLDIKYPAWQFQTRWGFLFPSTKPCKHPRTGKLVRWCMGPEIIQRAVKAAAERGGVAGKVTPHCLRHAFCTHLLDTGESMRRVSEAMGHTDIRTTAGYARPECLEVRSPLDKIIQFPKSA